MVLTPKGGPGDARGAEGCFERRDATLTVGATREKFGLGTLFKVTGEHHRAESETQVADEEQQRNAHRQPRGALVVDVKVGDREVRARLVGSSAELAGDNHVLDSTGSIPELARDEERRTRVVALEGVLVEETCAVLLGDHVEIVLQALVVAKAGAFLHADHMPHAIEVTCQQTRVRTS